MRIGMYLDDNYDKPNPEMDKMIKKIELSINDESALRGARADFVSLKSKMICLEYYKEALNAVKNHEQIGTTIYATDAENGCYRVDMSVKTPLIISLLEGMNYREECKVNSMRKSLVNFIEETKE